MIRDDFSGHYLPACKIKILADDGQAVDSLAEAQSPSFVLDTIPPRTNASPVGGTYSRWAMVTLAASDDSKVRAIYYTTDGSTPTSASPRYTAPIAIEKSATLKFSAVDSFGNQEPVKTENYVISKKVTVSIPGAVWPGSSMKITCQVQYTDGSLVSGEAISFTLSVDGSATFDPDAITGKVLKINSARNQALIQTSAGKVIINLTDSRAEEVSLTVRDTEGLGLEISGTAFGLTAKFFDPDLDEDHDGLPNRMETSGCLKVNSSDSDVDGMPDGYEYNHSCLDPCDPGSTANPAGGQGDIHPSPDHGPYGDPDGDGVSNLAEYRWGTDPCLEDTDGDGLNDGLEWGTDSNHDTPISTAMSYIDSSQKPCDSDGDGLINALDLDSDNDGLPDNKEYFNLKTSYSSPDTDIDGKPDGFEVGADPNHPALCIGDKGETRLCALDSGNNQQKPVIKSIRPCWSSSGTATGDDGAAPYTIAISGQNLTRSTLIAIERQETPSEVGKCSIEGEASGVCIRGNYAYLAVGAYGLLMIDISQPDHPLVKGNYEFEENAYGVCITGNYACVAAGYAGFLVVDISQPDHPVVKGSFNTPGYARGVWAQGNMAYVADEWAGLQIIDFSQPEQPVLKGSLNTPDWAYGVCGQKNYVYVAAGYSGLLAVDVSQPETPVLTASCLTPGCAFGVSVFEGCACVADSYSNLQLIDITHPAYPFLMTSIKLPDKAQDQVLGLTVSNDRLYLASGSGGFSILTRPSFWLAQTREVNAAGTKIEAVLLIDSILPTEESGASSEVSGLPTGSCTIKAVNPPYGEADLFTQVFETAITNTPPHIRDVSASQRKDGSVAITYNCFDQEQSTVKILFQYWDGFQWKEGQATTGDGPQATGSNLTGVWRAKEDFGGQNLTNCLIRIKADDDQSGNCLAEAQSQPFTLDTRPPVITITPLGGACQTPPTVTLITDEAAVIYYTTDGTNPVSGSGTGAGTGASAGSGTGPGSGSKTDIYTDPLKLTGNTTLKVLAVDSYGNQGAIRKEVYTISSPPQTPATGTPQTQGGGNFGVSLPTSGSYGSLYGSLSGSLYGSGWTSFTPYNVLPSVTSFGYSTAIAPVLGSFSSFNSFNSFNSFSSYLAPSTSYLYSSSSFLAPSYGYGLTTGYGLGGVFGTAGGSNQYSAGSSNLSLGNYNYFGNYGWSSGGLSLPSYNAANGFPFSSYSSPLLSLPYIY